MRWQKGTACKLKSKESWNSIIHIQQDRLEKKDYYKRKEEHYAIIKGSIPKKIKTIVSMYMHTK